MKITGQALADTAHLREDQVLIVKYAEEDCQDFVEKTIRMAGGSIKDYLGSNDMLRNALSCLYTLEDAKANGTLLPGALVFIVKHDGLEPVQYRNDGMGNATHVGIYIGNGLVVHSSFTAEKVVESQLSNGWTHAGWQINVDYSDDYGRKPEPTLEIAIPKEERYGVISVKSGGNVFHRISPNSKSPWFGRIKDGETVEIVSVNVKTGWSRVRYGGHDGYVMSKYIGVFGIAVPMVEGPDSEGENSDEAQQVAESEIASYDLLFDELRGNLTRACKVLDLIIVNRQE